MPDDFDQDTHYPGDDTFFGDLKFTKPAAPAKLPEGIVSDVVLADAFATVAKAIKGGEIDLADAELRIINAVLVQSGGNKSETATVLGIGRSTLHRKLKLGGE